MSDTSGILQYLTFTPDGGRFAIAFDLSHGDSDGAGFEAFDGERTPR